MIIIEDEGEWDGKRRDFVDQGGQENIGRWSLLKLKSRKRSFIQAWMDGLQGSEEIPQKAVRIVIIVIEGKPGERKRSSSQGEAPFSQQGGFAKSRGG